MAICLISLILISTAWGQEPPPCGSRDCEGKTSGTVYENVTLPGYPNCTVTFFVVWEKCPDGVITLSFPKVYWATPTGSGCQALKQRLFQGGAVDWDFVSWIYDAGYYAIIQKYFDNQYANALPWDKYKYECPNVSYSVYRGVFEACVDWVYYDDPVQYITRVEKQPCSTQVCCIKRTTICYDTQTQADVITDSWESQPSPAPQCTDVILPLPSGAIAHSGCRVFCGLSTAGLH